MITKIPLLFSFFLCLITSISCGQSGNNSEESEPQFLKFTCQYLTMDYPSTWKIQKEKNRLLFYLPEEQDRHLSSPSFHLTFQGRYALQNSKMFFEAEKDFPTPGKKFFREEIAGKQAMAYRSIGSGDVINIRYWFEVAPKKEVMIHIAGYADHLELHGPLFDQVKKSIQLIKQRPPRKTKPIEVTNEQLTGVWQEENIPYGPTKGFKISKFEKVIRKLWDGETTIRISDDSTEINDWNTFFAWKPFSELKDVQIYSYYRGIGDQLNIFGQQVYLGDYDHLNIQQLEDNHLQLDFTKTTGEKIKWILGYEESHNLPLNQLIELNRFTLKNESSFSHSKGLTGKVIIFAINGEKYTVRVKTMKVF